MELKPVSEAVVRGAHPQYSGGLRVARVREDGGSFSFVSSFVLA